VRRVAVLALTAALTLALLAVSCGGGDKGTDGLVAIHRLDLEGTDLNPLYFLNPPPENDYPGVVATVNKVAITGDELASRQVMLELGRQQVLEEWVDVFPLEIVDVQLEKVESEDPLQKLIDDELERQAVVRFGLLPSYEEAVEYTRGLEKKTKRALERAPPDEREAHEEALRIMGLLKDDWAADSALVQRYQQGMGLAKLRQQECRWEVKTVDYVNASAGHDCSEFLRQERERAEIVYYVRWAD